MRLIDSDKLNRKKKYSFQTVFGAFPKNEWFIKAVDLFSAPTVDAVPVVRCKDCKHCVRTEDGEFNQDDIVCDFWMTDGLKSNAFCSYGKRRDEDEQPE